MKITQVKVLPVEKFLFVQVHTDEGITGLGESGAWGLLAASGAAIQMFAEYLVGQDPLRIEHHWQTMYRANHFRGAAVMGAVSAIDIALWDIAGKYYGAPVHQLLGGRCRDRVRAYCHVRGKTLPELIARCKQGVAEGFTALGHISPFLDEPIGQPCGKTYAQTMGDAVAVVEAVREAVGGEIDLCIELHRRLKPAEAIALAGALEPYRPYFLEDPVLPDNFDSMAQVARGIRVPLATGERLHTPQEFQMLAVRRAADYLRPSICLCGGFTGARKIAAIAEASDLLIVPHNPLSPVSTAACVQLAAATPAFAIQEYPDDHRLRRQSTPGEQTREFKLSELVDRPLDCRDGYLEIPRKPGIGIALADGVEERFPFSPDPIRMRLRDDGSVMDQ